MDIERYDRQQQDRKATAVPVAVVKKFVEDQSTNLAAMMAFWAFFSIFPLMLAFTTLLGWLVPGDTKDKVLTHLAEMFPVLNPNQIQGLNGSWIALVIGLVSALWSGTAVVRTAQYAFNSVWEVPMVERPKITEKIGRSLLVLAVLGLGFILTTAITSLVSGSGATTGLNLGWFSILAGYVVSLAFDIGLFLAAFHMLTDRELEWRDHLPGALLSGIAFFVLQSLSTLLISRYEQNANDTYGKFYTTITLLWWFYLQGQLTLAGAQLNVVLKDRLWPRSLVGGAETRADRASYDAYAQERTYLDEERVDTRFSADGDDHTGEGADGSYAGTRPDQRDRRSFPADRTDDPQ